MARRIKINMESEERKRWEELRRRAGLEGGTVYSTEDRSTHEQREKVNVRDKNAIEFSKAKENEGEHLDWVIGPHGTAELKGEDSKRKKKDFQ